MQPEVVKPMDIGPDDLIGNEDDIFLVIIRASNMKKKYILLSSLAIVFLLVYLRC